MYQIINLEDVPTLKKYTKSKLSFPLNYDEDLAFLGEAIRVEGSLNQGTKNMTFTNKDISLLNMIEKILKKFNCSIYRVLFISIEIPEEINKEDIKIVDVSSNKEKLRFHIRESVRFDRKRKELIFIEPKIDYGTEKDYKILLKNKEIKVRVTVPKESGITIDTTQNSSAYIQLTFANFALREVFSKVLQIQEGRKSRKIFIPEILKSSEEKIVYSAINAVLACEGFLIYQKPPRSNRSIGIEMTSRLYLEGIMDLLKKANIISYLTYREKRGVYSLQIYGKENLLKIKQHISFVQPTKKQRFEKMLQYKELLGEEAENLTISILKELGGKGTISQISEKIGKKEKTVGDYLRKLKKEGKITKIDRKTFKLS
jgi:hypothetical protein